MTRVTTLGHRLGELTTTELSARLVAGPVIALVPVGSTEPHGPHLPLSTDARISEAVAHRAAERLATEGQDALVCPGIPYGVTDFAEGFAGAVTIPAEVLTAFLRAVGEGLLAQGFSDVCFINNHLEPAHDAAVRAAAKLVGPRASVACPLTRKWARTLTDEFKSGACHAGQYETSVVKAIDDSLVRTVGRALPALSLSLSEGIKAGQTTFRAIGMNDAYTGAPGGASIEEGNATLERLTDMVLGEIAEARSARG